MRACYLRQATEAENFLMHYICGCSTAWHTVCCSEHTFWNLPVISVCLQSVSCRSSQCYTPQSGSKADAVPILHLSYLSFTQSRTVWFEITWPRAANKAAKKSSYAVAGWSMAIGVLMWHHLHSVVALLLLLPHTVVTHCQSGSNHYCVMLWSCRALKGCTKRLLLSGLNYKTECVRLQWKSNIMRIFMQITEIWTIYCKKSS